VARAPSHSEGYGSPNGFEPLRALFARQLAMRQVSADSGRIVLTQGASQALDLAVRALLEPGDVVVVEDPAYPPTLELLRARGVRLIEIARLATGPDVEALARILKLQHIRAVFTNTTLQNPTGTSTTREVALALVKLAQTHDFTIVEDDIFAELSPAPVAPIVAFDDGRHVLYVSSISKTVSPTLRVGYVLTGPTTLAPIIRLKTLSALASSELSERVAFAALTHPHYRRHLSALRRRLAVSQERVQATLVTHGVDLKHRPDGGMFLWGRLRSALPVGKLWQNAVDAGVLLAPGESFCPDGRASPWWRFNVAHCEDRALTRFLATLRGEPGSGVP
jgi:DNA-binding transcriptional MocR family regulator